MLPVCVWASGIYKSHSSGRFAVDKQYGFCRILLDILGISYSDTGSHRTSVILLVPAYAASGSFHGDIAFPVHIAAVRCCLATFQPCVFSLQTLSCGCPCLSRFPPVDTVPERFFHLQDRPVAGECGSLYDSAFADLERTCVQCR